jgi:hypothetical protein
MPVDVKKVTWAYIKNDSFEQDAFESAAESEKE